MTIYDIVVLSINDVDMEFDSGYLNLDEYDSSASWNVEVYGANQDGALTEINTKDDNCILKIGTKYGEAFLGKGKITKLEIGPLGNTVKIKGVGKLEQVQNRQQNVYRKDAPGSNGGIGGN